jgi:hypothetical protein
MPPIDFAVSDKEMVASIEKTGGGQAIKNLLVSTEQPYIDHFTSIFNELWKGGIDAKDRLSLIFLNQHEKKYWLCFRALMHSIVRNI